MLCARGFCVVIDIDLDLVEKIKATLVFRLQLSPRAWQRQNSCINRYIAPVKLALWDIRTWARERSFDRNVVLRVGAEWSCMDKFTRMLA